MILGILACSLSLTFPFSREPPVSHPSNWWSILFLGGEWILDPDSAPLETPEEAHEEEDAAKEDDQGVSSDSSSSSSSEEDEAS